MKYRKRYRIESHRMATHDYHKPGYYFITICTNSRLPWFGRIHEKRMCVNRLDTIVYNIWDRIPNHFNNVVSDQFVVMPDHVHGIIRIVDRRHPVETLHATSLPQRDLSVSSKFSNISPKRGSLSVVIRSFKSAVSRQIHQTNPLFRWQTNYHDRIIRTERELRNVRNYIHNNPRNG